MNIGVHVSLSVMFSIVGMCPVVGLLSHMIVLFNCVHGILKARIPKWFSTPFSNGPRFVRPWLVGTCPSAVPGSLTTCPAPWLSHFCRLQQCMNLVLPDVQAGLRKGRGSRGQIASTHWITEKARGLKKKSTSTSLMMLKPLTMWITTNCGKLLKRWGYHTTLPVTWETCMQEKKQQLEPNMEQWTGSKLGK